MGLVSACEALEHESDKSSLLGEFTVAPKSLALDDADCTTCPSAFLKLAKFILTALYGLWLA